MPLHVLKKYKNRVMTEPIREIKRHPARIKYAFLAIFVFIRKIETLDYFIDLLIEIVNKIKHNGKKNAEIETLHEAIKVNNPRKILYDIFIEYKKDSKRHMNDVIPLIINEETIDNIIEEYELKGVTFKEKEKRFMLRSFHHYRQIVPIFLKILEFNSNNSNYKPVIEAIALLQKYSGEKKYYFLKDEKVPIDGIISTEWTKLVFKNGNIRRIPYELCLLLILKDKIRCR